MYQIDRMIEEHKDPLDPLQTILGVKGTINCKLSEMLTRHSNSDKHSLSVCADLKRESPTHVPSASGIRLSFLDAGEVVDSMSNTGFDVILVNTDHIAYKGSIDDLKSSICAAQVIGRRLRPAIVMKDIFLHPLQLAQAAYLHADGVVLNSFYLGPALEFMIDTAYNLGIEPIVEVHTLEEALYAIQLHAKILMVNQWNRLTNKCYLNRALQIMEIVPDGVISIACGGIKTIAQVEQLGLAGYDAVVLGKKLVDADIPELVSAIKNWRAPCKGILAISKPLFFESQMDETDLEGGGHMINMQSNYKQTLEEMNKFYSHKDTIIGETPQPKDVLIRFIGNDMPERWVFRRNKWMEQNAHNYTSVEHATAVYDFNSSIELHTALECNKKLLSQHFKKEMIQKLEEAIGNYVRKCYLKLKRFTANSL